MNTPALKEDAAAEREFFDRFYRERRSAAPDPLVALWTKAALSPRTIPLDYWEYMFHLLGDLRGKRVLDIGCGGGWLTRLLALKGALVSAIDVSEEGCVSTRLKLQAENLPFESVHVGDAHALEFACDSFDVVFVAGVLHHVNIAKVAEEIRRVLKPGGILVGEEPMRYGAVVRGLKNLWLRLHGLKPEVRTEHEESLSDADLIPLRSAFHNILLRKFNLLAKTNRMTNRFCSLAQFLRWADYILLSLLPPLRRYCTCVVFRAQK